MIERTFAAIPTIICRYCDICGNEMLPSGIDLLTRPPLYQHWCSERHVSNYPEHYPVVRWTKGEPIG